eukprot:g78995.t1
MVSLAYGVAQVRSIRRPRTRFSRCPCNVVAMAVVLHAYYWVTATLTSSHRPVYMEQEIELSISTPASVYYGDDKVHREGTLYASTHRIIWVSSSDKPISLALPLLLVKMISKQAGFIGFSSPKIRLHLDKHHVHGAAPSPDYLLLSFHDKSGRDPFYDQIEKALRSKTWELDAKILQPALKPSFKTSSAGIGGIIRQVERRQKEEHLTSSEAFKDLESLMEHAQKVVKLAARYANEQEQAKKKGQEEKGKEESYQNLLLEMGIPSPVTKASAGSTFHVQLARQLGDFLIKPLAQAGGTLTLVDVYCIFNRARGTALISPDDLLKACQQFTPLRIPLTLRSYPSGVRVIQSADQSDDKVCSAIVEAIKQKGPMTELEISDYLNWSLILAQNHVETCERRELICRDESVEGTRFFTNEFTRFALELKSQ